MQQRSSVSCLLLGIGFGLFANPAAAQSTPDLRPGNFELGLYTGASYGVDSFRPMGGVNLSYSLPKLLLPYVEFSYFPELVRSDAPNGANYHFVYTAKLYDVHAGVHVRVLPHESRVVPYGVIGFGVLNSDITGASIPTTSYCNQLGLSSSQCSALGSGHTEIKGNDATLNFGAGLRVYHTSYLGYRVEYKLYRPVTGQFTNFFSKAEGGIFFQFGHRERQR
jgi:hypothetical protein